jgi:hypothetical protein
MEAPAAPEDRHALNRNIERTVDKTALRKVRQLVDNFDADERARGRHQSRIAIVIVGGFLFLLIAAITLYALDTTGISRAEARKQRVAACEQKVRAHLRNRVEEEALARNPAATKEEVAARVAQFEEIFAFRAKEECVRSR